MYKEAINNLQVQAIITQQVGELSQYRPFFFNVCGLQAFFSIRGGWWWWGFPWPPPFVHVVYMNVSAYITALVNDIRREWS